jgi:diaminopropionate ammonia-lyase
VSWRYSIHSNARVARDGAYGFADQLSLAGERAARAAIGACPVYRPTPLRRLDHAARDAGVHRVWYKDEANRFGLGSFKALGGAYAVAQLLAESVSARLGRSVPIAELAGKTHVSLTGAVTVACASDGNHGRSVAAGARLFGCRCVIFLHGGVSPGRAQAISELGAQVVRTPGVYDDSVRLASETCDREGWILVSDTAGDGGAAGRSTPLAVMQGYAVLAAEVLEQLDAQGEAPPTHVILQGGVGGLAAAMVAHFWEALGPSGRPTFIVVEPERADCLLQSAIAGDPRLASSADLDTVMAGLACGEVSRVAWPIVQAGVRYFMTVEDAATVAAMRVLAATPDGQITAGESGAAGLAALLALTADRAHEPRPADLTESSRVLLIGTEGATDPVIYGRLIEAANETAEARG